MIDKSIVNRKNHQKGHLVDSKVADDGESSLEENAY